MKYSFMKTLRKGFLSAATGAAAVFVDRGVSGMDMWIVPWVGLGFFLGTCMCDFIFYKCMKGDSNRNEQT